MRRDTLDFRDLMYIPTLIEVPERRDLRRYLNERVPVLDQGDEGACTGFGLATVAHYLLRTRKIDRSTRRVSPHMLYAMAKRYDEWAGEHYEGSSARGAMKGWHKHGLCSEEAWPSRNGGLTATQANDAVGRPLGAYFRVNHKDLVAMHAAITEVGVLYATACVHDGWDRVGSGGVIPYAQGGSDVHAFAIVAYDEKGFWIQNSWGRTWGRRGLAHLSYDDWLANGTDVWVARLGVPVSLRDPAAVATAQSALARVGRSVTYAELRPHVISLGNDGRFRTDGTYGTSEAEVRAIIEGDFVETTRSWKRKRLLLYAHGGLVKEEGAIQRVADYRATLLEQEIYPLAFVWKTDFWTTVTNILDDTRRRRRPEGVLDDAKDFLLDRADDFLEPVARSLSGRAVWNEMKENALLATTAPYGGVRETLGMLASLVRRNSGIEIHVAGHSAGAILLAPLVALLSSDGSFDWKKVLGSDVRFVLDGDGDLTDEGLGIPITTCTLWAPACRMDLFEGAYAPLIKTRKIGRFALFTLTDIAEQCDNCAQIYHKSLLYLVSNALEKQPRIPIFHPEGDPLLGMEKFVRGNNEFGRLLRRELIEWVQAPNTRNPGDRDASTAQHHGDFDDDPATLQATVARIRNVAGSRAGFQFHRSKSSLRRRRIEVSANSSLVVER